MADQEVDLMVVGAGSGGVRAARLAAAHGARVVCGRGRPDRRHLRQRRLHPEEALQLCGLVWRGPGRSRRLRLAHRGPRLRLGDAEAPACRRDPAPERHLRQPARGFGGAAGAWPGAAARAERGARRARSTGAATVNTSGARHVLIATGGHPTRPALPGIEHSGRLGRDVRSAGLSAAPGRGGRRLHRLRDGIDLPRPRRARGAAGAWPGAAARLRCRHRPLSGGGDAEEGGAAGFRSAAGGHRTPAAGAASAPRRRQPAPCRHGAAGGGTGRQHHRARPRGGRGRTEPGRRREGRCAGPHQPADGARGGRRDRRSPAHAGGARPGRGGGRPPVRPAGSAASMPR